MKYNGRVDEEGKLHIIHRKLFDLDLKQEFARPGKKIDVVIEIKKKRSERTLSQNAFYWGVIVVMVRDRLRELTGERFLSKEQAHEFLCMECHFREVVNEETGLIVRMRKDTHDLSKMAYAEMIDKMIEWCNMYLDITIPQPNTQATMAFDELNTDE